MGLRNPVDMSDLRFQKLSAQYETQRLASSLEQETENEAGQIADVGRFRKLADRCSD